MKKLIKEIYKFSKERDWEQFHSPKNLAIGLSVEASELLEIFTWLSEDESYNLSEDQLNMIKEEIGDIFIYLLAFCDKLEIDHKECAFEKLEINKNKYPIKKVKGSSKKYNEY